MRAYILLMLALLVGAGTAPGQVSARRAYDPIVGPEPSAASQSTAAREPPSWWLPVAKLDDALPDWIFIGGEYRNRLEGPIHIGYGTTNDFYLLDRLRVRVVIMPEHWLTLHGAIQDARIFFNHHTSNGNPYEDSWTLWEAYPQIGSSTEGWGDILAGRQVLRFADERVIGPSDWLNVGRTFNVARVDLHSSQYTLSLFASSVVPGDNTDLHNVLPGNDLYGIYGSTQSIVPRANLEPYVLWRVAPANSGLPEEVGRGHLNEVTIGLHGKGTLPADFDYDTEFDGQKGTLGASSIGAWAGYTEVGKTFPKARASPRLFVDGNYASGTKNPAGRDWNTFDELYPSNHDKYGFADLVGRRNLVHCRVGIEEDPTSKWKLKQQFEDYRLVTSNDNLYASSGAISVPAHSGANRHIGDELDLVDEYTLNSGFNFGFGYAHLFTGQFLKTTTPGHDYGYVYAYFEYNFSKSGFHFPLNSNQPRR